MTTRKIYVTFTNEFLDSIIENRVEFQKTLGYLCQWSIGSDNKKEVKIFGHDNGDMSAIYTDGQEQTFEIFAQRAEDGSYSTHS